MKQPNILFITDDQHRWDFYGDTSAFVHTPHIDRLRQKGKTFTHAYSNCPICAPTRFTWLHGLYTSQVAHMLLVNEHPWPEHHPTFAQILQQNNYHTALIGKLHSLGSLQVDVRDHYESTKARGFHDVIETSGKAMATHTKECEWSQYLKEKKLHSQYKQDMLSRTKMYGGGERFEASFLSKDDSMDSFIGKKAREWLDNYQSEKPFFLHLSFCGPHFPLDPPKEFFEKYKPEDMPMPQGVPNEEKAKKRWQEMQALYCAMIEHVDNEIGRFISALEEKKLLDNTIIFYGSDHGDMMGNKNMESKGKPYDGSTRTPVTICYPKVVQSGTVSNSMVEACDLPCTILEAAGITPAEKYLYQTPGISYWQCAIGDKETHRDWVYAECGVGQTAWRMIRTYDCKYVFRKNGDHELYNMIEDPWELKNVINLPENKAQLGIMKEKLISSLSMSVAPIIDRKNKNIDNWIRLWQEEKIALE